ncbi:MAG: aldo/keto reductase, partial [Actinobacteria bacterium]|nr:aldo/keto reductase [Actinomycetota bacterium]
MERRMLGDGLEVSAIGLGCMGMTGHYGPADRDEAAATLERALELDCTFLDTAEYYGAGTNEELIADVLGTRRA